MRKRRSKNEWLAIIEEQQQSGLSIVRFCQQYSLSTTTFYSARARILGKAPCQSTFLKATVTKETERAEITAAPEVIRLNTRQAELLLPGHCPSQFVIDILKGLQA